MVMLYTIWNTMLLTNISISFVEWLESLWTLVEYISPRRLEIWYMIYIFCVYKKLIFVLLIRTTLIIIWWDVVFMSSHMDDNRGVSILVSPSLYFVVLRHKYIIETYVDYVEHWWILGLTNIYSPNIIEEGSSLWNWLVNMLSEFHFLLSWDFNTVETWDEGV